MTEKQLDRARWLIAGGLIALALVLNRRSGTGRKDRNGGLWRAAEPEQSWPARKPGGAPLRGWKNVLLRFYRSIVDDRVLAIAAGVTYYTLLAIFPAIVALVSLYGLVADAGSMGRHLDSLGQLLPGATVEVIREQITRVAANSQDTLGIGAAIGILFALWSANSGTKALFDALNVVYGENEKRGFFALNALSLAFTLAVILFLLLAFALVVALPSVLRQFPLRETAEWLVNILRWPALLVAVATGVALVYRYGPSRDKARCRWVSWGSAFAAFAWIAASGLFSWYAANFGKFNETYGSLGAVIGFMTWIWLSAVVLLVGAEIDAEADPQTVRDKTSGPFRADHTRGATKAETAGAAQA